MNLYGTCLHFEGLRAAIADGATAHHDSAFHVSRAARYNRADIVDLLLSNGAPVYHNHLCALCCASGGTPLPLDALRVLLEHPRGVRAMRIDNKQEGDHISTCVLKLAGVCTDEALWTTFVDVCVHLAMCAAAADDAAQREDACLFLDTVDPLFWHTEHTLARLLCAPDRCNFICRVARVGGPVAHLRSLRGLIPLLVGMVCFPPIGATGGLGGVEFIMQRLHRTLRCLLHDAPQGACGAFSVTSEEVLLYGGAMCALLAAHGARVDIAPGAHGGGALVICEGGVPSLCTLAGARVPLDEANRALCVLGVAPLDVFVYLLVDTHCSCKTNLCARTRDYDTTTNFLCACGIKM